MTATFASPKTDQQLEQSVTRYPASVPVSPDQIWRISVAQYHAMIEAGILTDDDAIELLEGWLVTKMPKKPLHRAVTHLVRKLLTDLISAGWYLDSQEPITILDSEPEPDVMVVKGNTLDYLDQHPGPADVALIIEVSDATLQRDRTLKQQIYATAEIPVYWIINLIENQVEVYTEPSGPTEQPNYGQRRTYGFNDQVPVMIAGNEIGHLKVEALLPNRES